MELYVNFSSFFSVFHFSFICSLPTTSCAFRLFLFCIKFFYLHYIFFIWSKRTLILGMTVYYSLPKVKLYCIYSFQGKSKFYISLFSFRFPLHLRVAKTVRLHSKRSSIWRPIVKFPRLYSTAARYLPWSLPFWLSVWSFATLCK